MDFRSLFAEETLLTMAWVTFLSFWGGVVSHIKKVRDGATRFNITELIGDLFTSGFSGWMTYYLCTYFETSEPLTAVMVGMSGHMGARAIYQLEQLVTKKITHDPRS